MSVQQKIRIRIIIGWLLLFGFIWWISSIPLDNLQNDINAARNGVITGNWVATATHLKEIENSWRKNKFALAIDWGSKSAGEFDHLIVKMKQTIAQQDQTQTLIIIDQMHQKLRN